MATDLDLDIRNYTIKDMEKFFQLSPTIKYSFSDIELKEAEIKEKLLKSGQVDKKFKRDLIDFLTKAKQWLISAKCNLPAPVSALPKITQLDRTDPIPQGSSGTLSSPTFVSEPYLYRENDVQHKPNAQFVHAMTSDYFAGNMNPLVTRTITKCLNIDTKFRDNISATNSSDMVVSLPLKLTKVVSMQLASIEIPFSVYGISNSYGNYFLNIEITYTHNGGSQLIQSSILSIPEGNYNSFELIDELNSLSAEITDDHNPFKYLMFSLDLTNTGKGTGKVTIFFDSEEAAKKGVVATNLLLDNLKNSNGTGDSISLISTKLAWNLGFTQPKYNGKLEYTSEGVANPFISRYMYLAIDDYNNNVNNHFISAFSKSTLSPNILARISLNGTFGDWIIENNHSVITEPRKYFGPVDIQRLRIQLLDDQGRLMDTNNANYSFCLNFKLLYDL